MGRILITGATGFIGKQFVPFLLAQGKTLRILVRKPCQFFPQEVQQHQGDLTKPASLTGVADGVECVFHLAGFAHAWQDSSNVDFHHQVNYLGTQNLLNECIRAQVKKFIFFSSIKSVGIAPYCVDETCTLPPSCDYGKAKLNAEQLILKQALLYNFHATVLRLSLVYGPGVKGNLYQMLGAIEKGYFPPIPPVENRRSLVNLYDVCKAALLASETKLANGKVYFLTDEKPYSTYELYEQMRTALGKKENTWHLPLWSFEAVAKMIDQLEKILRRRLPFNSEAFHKLFGSSFYSSDLIRDELGFASTYTFSDLLPEMIHAYRADKLC